MDLAFAGWAARGRTRQPTAVINGKRPSIAVVIAAKDEAATIADVIRRCRPFVDEIVVVDGHSRDQTPGIAASEGARVVTNRGRGKGDALRVGTRDVSSDITVFIDADGSHVPEDIPRLVAPIAAQAADHVSASRLKGGSSELHGGFDEFFRLTGSSLITACINWRFGVRLSDSQNGFRAIRTELFRRLDLRGNHTTIEQEMIMQTLKHGGRMDEIPSHEHARQYGASHIKLWRDAPHYLLSLLRGLFF
jgi:glycosyltransferase involved in cell wall biosynthesis